MTYHSLDESQSVLSTPPRLFGEQMRTLHELGLRPVSLVALREALREGSLDDLVAITFDDGFRNAHEHALPVLQQYAFQATVFLVTDYCGRTNSWPGQPARIERRPLLGWGEVRAMSDGGIAFGSHTRTHRDLTMIGRPEAEEELVASKKAIEDATGRPVEALAYPYGAHDEAIRSLAQKHFGVACSTALDFVRPDSDVLALERLDMYYLRNPGLLRRLFSPAAAAYIAVRRSARALRRRLPPRGARAAFAIS